MNKNKLQNDQNILQFQQHYDNGYNQNGYLASPTGSFLNLNQDYNFFVSPKNVGPGKMQVDINQVPFKSSARGDPNPKQMPKYNSKYEYGNMQTEEIVGTQVIGEFPSSPGIKSKQNYSNSYKSQTKSQSKQLTNNSDNNQQQQQKEENQNIPESQYVIKNKQIEAAQDSPQFLSDNIYSDMQSKVISFNSNQIQESTPVIKDKNQIQMLREKSKQIIIQKRKTKQSIYQFFKPKQVLSQTLLEFDLKVIINIWKFIYNIRFNSGIWGSYMYFNKIGYDLINDQASYTTFNKTNKKQQNIYHNQSTQDNIQNNKNKLILFIEELAVLNPDSSFFYFWDLIHCLIIILQMFFVPIEWVTASNFTDLKQWQIFQYLTITVFLLNVVLNFNVGYYDKGLCIMNRVDIFKQYIKFEFWADLLSIIPQLNQLLLFDNELRIVNFFIVFKIKSIYVILKKYQEMSSIKKNVLIPSLIRLGRLFFNILFAAHIIGCIFLGIAIKESESGMENNWIQKYDETLIDKKWFIQYFYCLYWAVTTMTSVGYGDITPANEYETIFVTFIMFVACFTFAYSFNLIGMLVDDMNSNQKQFNHEMKQFQNYFDSKNIDKGLQQEIRKHLEYQYHASNDLSVQDEQNIIEKVPEGMKQKLIQSANVQYLEKVKFLKHFTPQLFKQLVLKMESTSGLNNENILDQNDNTQDPCIYFIVKGTILILAPKAGGRKIKNSSNIQQFDYLYEDNSKEQLLKNYTIIQKLGKYEYFGEEQFLLGTQSQTIAKCDGPCHLLKIKRSEFLELIQLNESDKEVFCFIRDKSLIIKDLSETFINCHNCKKKGHTTVECPYIHFIPNKEILFLRLNYNTISTKRVRYLRNQEKNPDPLIDFNLNAQIAQEVIEDLEQDEYEDFILKYYKLSPYEERLENFFTVQDKKTYINLPNSQELSQSQNSNQQQQKTKNLIRQEETESIQSPGIPKKQSRHFSNNFYESNQFEKSPQSNNKNKLQIYPVSVLGSQMQSQVNFGKRTLDQSYIYQGGSSYNSSVRSSLAKSSRRLQLSLEKYQNFKSKLHEQVDTIQSQQTSTSILLKQFQKSNDDEISENQKKFIQKKLQNINYVKRLQSIQESTINSDQKIDMISQQQIQEEKPLQQQQNKQKFANQLQNSYQLKQQKLVILDSKAIQVDYPSVNTDIIKFKGFETYFPNNNIFNIILDLQNQEQMTLQQRNKNYHLYHRSIIFNNQVEKIKLIERQSIWFKKNNGQKLQLQRRRTNLKKQMIDQINLGLQNNGKQRKSSKFGMNSKPLK